MVSGIIIGLLTIMFSNWGLRQSKNNPFFAMTWVGGWMITLLSIIAFII